MSVISNNQLAGAAGQGGADFMIERSLRFNDSDQAYLSSTISANITTFTYSFWVKRCVLGNRDEILDTPSSTGFYLYFDNDGYIKINDNTQNIFTSNGQYRDPSAWMHVVVNNNGSTLNLYVNGVLDKAASITTKLYSGAITIGTNHATDAPDYYLAEVHFIDGQALAPTDFGEYDDNNVWQPKEYDGTYGTNGFHLDFSDNSSTSNLGIDSSGNSNTWTVSNFSVASGSGNDSLIDTPMNYEASPNNGGNYATLNPLAISPNVTPTLSNGNLEIERTATSGQWTSCGSTFTVGGGKYYWELNLPTINGTIARWGVADADDYEFNRDTSGTGLPWLGSSTGTSWALDVGGNTYHNGSTVNSSYTSTVTTSDVIGVALDCDANTLTFYKNGTSLGVAHSNVTASRLVPAVSLHGGTHNKMVLNFGQRPFAHTPPTGYKSLCTTNLPDPTIADGSTAFDAKTFTGNHPTGQSITGLNFSPDFVWLKDRAGGNWHYIFDAIRGTEKGVFSNATNAEGTYANTLTAFNSDGFTLGSDNATNQNGNGYVAWTWDAGSSTVSNTDGSITSSVRANPSTGFSIVTYTGTEGGTFGHGLNAAPELVIVKRLNSAAAWCVWHKAIANTQYLMLDSTAGVNTYNVWGNTSPTSTVVSVSGDSYTGNLNDNYVAYCFAPVEGYSAFGSYTGNGSGSADGPFVFTGHRSRWIMIKRTNSTGDWLIYDTARDEINAATKRLYPNLGNAEADASDQALDILSNGFCIKGGSNANYNASGGAYVYASFAEHPFKTARAR